MTDWSKNTTPWGSRSYLGWPYVLVWGKYDCHYDWHYLSARDAHFCTVVSLLGFIAQATFVVVLADIAVVPLQWKSFLLAASCEAVFYALLTWARTRLRDAAIRAADSGRANDTNETALIFKDTFHFVLHFFTFPYEDASGPIVSLFVGWGSIVAVGFLSHKLLVSTEPMSGTAISTIAVPTMVIYLGAYYRYRNPRWLVLLRNSRD